MEIYFLISTLSLHWGFIVRQVGSSAAQLAYVMPPPGTVVGAFMNPLARILDVGDGDKGRTARRVTNRAMECAIRSTLAASAGISPDSKIGLVSYEEPSRLLAGVYKTGGDYQSAIRSPIHDAVARLMPVQAVGSTSGPTAKLTLAWAVDVETLSRCINKEIGRDDLVSAAWSVYRLGSREGIVSIAGAEVFDHSQLEVLMAGERFRTYLYQRRSCVKVLSSDITQIPLPVPPDYRENLFVVPTALSGSTSVMLRPARMPLFEVKGDCKAIRPKNRDLLTITFREV